MPRPRSLTATAVVPYFAKAVIQVAYRAGSLIDYDLFRRLLGGYDGPATNSDYYAWESEIIQAALALAKPLPDNDCMAKCPLCGETPGTAPGFSLWRGLEMHLQLGEGWSECSVLQAARSLSAFHPHGNCLGVD